MSRLRCLAAAVAAATTATAVAAAQTATTGNGAPSGSHYNLNIIGVSHDKNPNMDGGSGNVIFVGLGTKNVAVTTKILLSQSAAGTFSVLDKNGTDGEASFALPAPGGYTVWARALGTPGGKAKITTCATDITLTGFDGAAICSTQNEVFVRGTGKSSFRNVTTALTTITLDPVADAAAVTACGGTTVSLFDACLEGFFWQYDNNGLRLLQVRFYPNPS
ncbi:MAG: hypothetical protein E6J18_15390 [Chloroflexi bacterium]|nr:MAG: hypothetical protein E6J18_15390 [Chloroflexota bacterium]